MKTALKMISLVAVAMMLAQPAKAEGTATAPAPAAAAATAAPSPKVETKMFESWRMECVSAPKGNKKFCQLFQRLVAEDTKKKKHVVLITKAAVLDGKAKDGKDKEMTRMMIITPLGTMLQDKLKLKLDNEETTKVEYLSCGQEGCMVDLKLSGKLLEKIKSGKKLQVTYRLMMAEKPYVIDIPLSGLSAGLKALAEKQG